MEVVLRENKKEKFQFYVFLQDTHYQLLSQVINFWICMGNVMLLQRQVYKPIQI